MRTLQACSFDASVNKTRTAKNHADLHVDAKDGALFIANRTARKATYSAVAAAIALAASAQDVFEIKGAANKRIEITRITISGVQTTAGLVAMSLIRRSTANSAGSSTAPTAAKYEVSDPEPAATLKAYTANAAAGTAAGTLRTVRAPIGVATDGVAPTVIEFGQTGKPVVLASATESLVLNLGGATVSGGSLDVTVEWVESAADA